MDPVTTCWESAVKAKQVIRSACDTVRLSSGLSPPDNDQIRTQLSPSESTYIHNLRSGTVRMIRYTDIVSISWALNEELLETCIVGTLISFQRVSLNL